MDMVFTTGGAKLGGPPDFGPPSDFNLAPPTSKVGGAKSHENFLHTFFHEYGPQWLQNVQKIFWKDFYVCRTPKHCKNVYTTHICPDFDIFSRKQRFSKIFDPKITFLQQKSTFVETIASSCSFRALPYTSLTYFLRTWTAQVTCTMIPKNWREHMTSLTLKITIIYPQSNVPLTANYP